MAKVAPIEVVVRVEPASITALEAASWEAGLRHALSWLGLKQYADVMVKDNPHRKAER